MDSEKAERGSQKHHVNGNNPQKKTDSAGEIPADILGDDFDKVPFEFGPSMKDNLQILFGYFSKNTYNSHEIDPRAECFLHSCIDYLKKDYDLSFIDNKNGVLSKHYPSVIPVIGRERSSSNLGCVEEHPIEHMISKEAVIARCRTRFPVPVIYFKGKSVCRSGTLAGSEEIFFRQFMGKVEDVLGAKKLFAKGIWPFVDNKKAEFYQTIKNLQKEDAEFLTRLGVGTVFDLMVEQRKRKYAMPVTLSEKYEDCQISYSKEFDLFSIPYPGCEFFREFHENSFCDERLHFDWKQTMCDAVFTLLPKVPNFPDVEWAEYRNWDLVTLTKNYLLYILKYLQDSKKGILVHCISGWDRTPLFISLIRISLWADNLIHTSLGVEEMLFFTVAYDWVLFGHHLTDRLKKKEDIFLFCFNFLKHITGDEFSLNPTSENAATGCSTNAGRKRKSDTPSDVLPNKQSQNTKSQSPTKVCQQKKQTTTEKSVVGTYFESMTSSSMFESDLDNVSSSAFPISQAEDFERPVSPEFDDLLDESYCMLSYPSPEVSAHSSVKRTPPMKILVGGKNRPDSKKGSDFEGISSSWQMVSKTGSFRSSSSDFDMPSFEEFNAETPQILSRKEKLTAMRKKFYEVYYNSIHSIEYTGKEGIMGFLSRQYAKVTLKSEDNKENTLMDH